MTLEEIEARVQKIRDMAGDYEAAHSEEDKLRKDFIEYVASIKVLAVLSKKAALVLSTRDIDFPRYTA